MLKAFGVCALAIASLGALTGPSAAVEDIAPVIAPATVVSPVQPVVAGPQVEGLFRATLTPNGQPPAPPAESARTRGGDPIEVTLGEDGQAYVPAEALLPRHGLGPIGGGAVYVAFYVPYQVNDHPDTERRKVPRPTTSSETVTAWSSAVFLGTPTATRTVIDQWVAAAHFLGPRRR